MQEVTAAGGAPPRAWADALARHWKTGAAVAALSLFAWPFGSLTPGIDGDWNWVAGLAIVAKEGHSFGSELIWNYGPLGLITLGSGPLLYYGEIAAVMFVYQAAMQVLLAATLYLAARRSYPVPVALLLAFATIALIADRALLLGFAWCVLALTRADGTPRDALARWFPLGIGALAGIVVLSKLNQGVEILALAAIALFARPARRPSDAATFGGALLAAVTIGWLATGQAVGDFPAYVRYSAETIGGYPAMAGVSDTDGAWRYWVALLVFAFGSALVWHAARAAAPLRRWGLAALWLVFAFASFKAGFIRHDEGHVALFAGSMLVAFVVLPVRPHSAWRAVALSGFVGCVVFFGSVAPGFRLWEEFDPLGNARAAAKQASTLASRDERRRQREELTEAILSHYAAPPGIVAGIGDRTVSFLPFAAGDLAYALDLDWRNPPIVEIYGASTPALDELVADMFSSQRAPERIVRRQRPPSAAGVSLDPPAHELMLEAPFEPPLTTRAVFCRYRELAREEGWQLLGRGGDRCGEPRPIATVEAPWGEPVEVPEPRPGTAVLVAVDGTDFEGIERLKALWLRPDARMIVLDRRPYRLVPSIASSGYLLSAAPDVDYRPPLNMAPAPARIAVRRIGTQPDGELLYTFLEVSVGQLALSR